MRKLLLLIVSMTYFAILAIGQEDPESVHFTSFDLRSGLAFDLGGSEPALSIGVGVQRLDQSWLYIAELFKHNT